MLFTEPVKQLQFTILPNSYTKKGAGEKNLTLFQLAETVTLNSEAESHPAKY